MLLYNKKAELTTTQIVSLIILILSFVIILFLIFQLNLGETTKKEVCRDSVILKGRSLLGATPLNCQQEYLCFSKTNSCDKLDNPDRVIKVASKNGFYRALGDEMADCWWMFGEGKINYVDSETFTELHCSVCSQFYFDKSMEDVLGAKEISQKEFYEYLSATNYSEGIDYYEYILGEEYKPISVDFERFNVDHEYPYLILMGINSDISAFNWALIGVGGGALLGGAIIATGGLVLVPIAIGAGIGAGVTGTFAGVVSYGLSGLSYLRPVIVEKESNHFEAYKCEYILTRS